MSWIQGNTYWATETIDEETMPGPQLGGDPFGEQMDRRQEISPLGPLGKLIMLDLSLEHPRGDIISLRELK